MPRKEIWEQELKSATSSYLTMPMWMRRIEEKIRSPKSIAPKITSKGTMQKTSSKNSRMK